MYDSVNGTLGIGRRPEPWGGGLSIRDWTEMAANEQVAAAMDFHKTETYKDMGAELRRALARYKRETGASDDYVSFQLMLVDLKHVDEETKKKAQNSGSWLLIIALLLDLAAVNTKEPIPIFVCTGLLMVLGLMWVTGRFNGIEAQKRNIRKRIRKIEKPTFKDWLAENESELAEKFDPKPAKKDDEDGE